MITILKNGIEIDVVKETLTINRDNKFLDNDFKIQANSYPFMIIENENTRLALGSRNETSVNRNTFHSVMVITPEGNFEGELQILSYLPNYRKCNLRFYSPIYNLRDKKISEFLPDRISTVSGPLQPLYGYEENRTTLIESDFMNTWETYGPTILTKGFPETLFNFPSIIYPDKFGNDIKEGDDWFFYRGVINNVFYDNGDKYMFSNSYFIVSGVQYIHQTVNAPMVYLLAPLKLAVESVGYTIKGNFYNNEFIKRILFFTEKDNLTTIDLRSLEMDIPYIDDGWELLSFPFINIKKILFQLPIGKRYEVEMQLKKTHNVPISAKIGTTGIAGDNIVDLFEDVPYNELQTVSAQFVTQTSGGDYCDVAILFQRISSITTEPFEVNYIRIYEVAEKKGYITHPIINLQRFVPDWSFIDYINELKKLWNLKITPNDHDKTISFDFFNDKFVDKTGIEIDSIAINTPETVEFDSLLLKYDNEEDDNIFVTKNAIIVGKNKPMEHTKEVPSKFKFLPVTANGLTLTKEIEDKSGVGLLIYDHLKTSTSYPVPEYLGYSLDLENIYNKNYGLSFTNYLSGVIYSPDAYLSKKQVRNVTENDFIFVDNKRYYVNTMSYKETPNGQYETKFELLLMMY